MKQYIATFYAHFGAVRYKKNCEQQGISAKMMPVPRALSSSCGTCVSYLAEQYIIDEMHQEELEQIVLAGDNGYERVYFSDGK